MEGGIIFSSNNQKKFVFILEHSSDLDTSDTSLDSEASIDGLPGHYYGGYGTCYNCGRYPDVATSSSSGLDAYAKAKITLLSTQSQLWKAYVV